jgi:O-antigen/teichoic acid export membrane protein
MNSSLVRGVQGLVRQLGLGDDLGVVLRGAGFTLIVQLVAVGLNYGSQILLARWMGPFEFGVYAFAWSLVPATAAAAALGLSGAAVRFVPQYLAAGRWGEVRGYLRRGSAIALAVGLGIAVAGAGLILVLERWIADFYVTPLRLALVCIPFLTVIALLSGTARGFGRVGLAFIPQSLSVPGLTLLAVIADTFTVGAPTATRVLSFAAVACAVTLLWNAIGFRIAVPDEVASAAPVYETRLWLRVAVPLFLSDGVFLFFWSADEVMLGSLNGPEEVSLYHACVKTAGLTLVFFNAMTALAAPRFAALWVDRGRDDQQRFARSVARWMFVPSAALVLALVLVGPYVLATFGPTFVAGQPILLVLALGYLAQASTGPVGAYLAVSGNQDAIVWITAGAAATNIVFNLVLIPPYGVMGAAVASVLSIVVCQGSQYVLVRRRLGIDAFVLSRG